MNTLKLIEHKPNFELEAMLKQISNMEIKPLKITDYYPTSFVLKPSVVSTEQLNTFFDKLRYIGYVLQNTHTILETK